MKHSTDIHDVLHPVHTNHMRGTLYENQLPIFFATNVLLLILSFKHALIFVTYSYNLGFRSEVLLFI